MLRRADEPNPSAPPVQRLRVRYAKRGKLRFTSHRDVARAFERALRRAAVPMAYSHGFNPHPRISWVGAAPTGAASEAEYVEIAVITELDPTELAHALDAALPPGLDIQEVLVARPGSLADRIEASHWRIEVPGVDPDTLAAAVRELLVAEAVEVEKMTKNGPRRIDVRPAIVSLRVRTAAPYGILEAVVRQTSPVVRPDDVLNALRVVAALTPPAPAKATRMAQGRLDDNGLVSDPLAPDRGLPATEAGEPESGQRVVVEGSVG
ncbi:MAG TPA: TIGR03936 family radical SAM-associated protein [Pseudonocardiaceae bacterium]|jgi:radical SAM-linked protein|nr:TIGR03936 family radical SAM-associated protein [Pseudonocardiaceae bacterium]